MGHIDQGSPTELLTAVSVLAALADGGSSSKRVLRNLCQLGCQVVGAEAATVMVLEQSRLRFAHAAPPLFAEMGRLQEQLQVGPCRESTEQQAVVAVDADQLQRWPAMATAASALGIAAVLSVPLVSRGQAWGVLDLYGTKRTPWEPAQILTASLLAQIAANYLAVSAEQTATGNLMKDLEHRATHDPLTSLPNRALLFDRLEHALQKATRHQESVAVLFIDLDHFKKINDTFGHAAGDAILIEVSHRLKGILRTSDTLARLSGDEFIVICEDIPGPKAIVLRRLEDLGRRIHAELNRPLALNESIQMTVSIGIAVARESSSDYSGRHLLGSADDAMYEAKQSGVGQTKMRSH